MRKRVLQVDGPVRAGEPARLVEEVGLGARVGRGFQAPSAWAEAQRWESRGHA